MVFVKEIEVIRKIGKAKLASDHLGLLMEAEGNPKWTEIEREAIDWDRVDETLGKNKKKREAVSLDWYYKLKGDTEYDKLL